VHALVREESEAQHTIWRYLGDGEATMRGSAGANPARRRVSTHVFSQDHPLIVQADGSILADAHHDRYDEARRAIAPYTEMVSAPEHVHTFRVSPISVWNALALGHDGDDAKIDIGRFARYGIPDNVCANLDAWTRRWGRIVLETTADAKHLRLRCADQDLEYEILASPKAARLLADGSRPGDLRVDPLLRGEIKWALVKLGFPVQDDVGFGRADPLDIQLVPPEGMELRDYQRAAVDTFHASGSGRGGHGVIVLPCGAGKTVVGVAAITKLRAGALVLCTSDAAVEQWIAELARWTNLPAEAVGRYTGRKKEVRPITVATYSVLTYRKNGKFVHLEKLRSRPFGLVVYDEVHLLPAPVFRMTAGLQAIRRLGLTATLLREDGREEDVFALIGPKRYDVPWKDLERRCFIAGATCRETRVELSSDVRRAYSEAEPRMRFRIAASSPAKDAVVRTLLEAHAGRSSLVLGVYLDQLRRVAKAIDAPLICGETPPQERTRLYDRFRAGELRTLVMSRVGSFAIDLPNASVAIEISGTYGSRQEEAQRLGRILRPKKETAWFHTVVSRDTVEQDFALRRQRFLAEQGYRYEVRDAEPTGTAVPTDVSTEEQP